MKGTTRGNVETFPARREGFDCRAAPGRAMPTGRMGLDSVILSAGERRNIILFAIPCLALSVVLGLLSDGVYHDDDLTHFLMARWSAWFPGYLLHVWGRPGITLPLSAVSGLKDIHLAWPAARILSAIVAAVTAVIAARLASSLGVRRAGWVVVACYAQPLAMVLSYTTLAETFAALYLTTAVALYHRHRPAAASLIWSLVLVSRHEMVALLPVWWIALGVAPGLRRQRIVAMALSLWAPIVHNLLHRWTFGTWPISLFLEPTGSTEYTAAGVLSYVPHALYAVSPVIGGLAIVGGVYFCRRRLWLVPVLAGVFFVIHAAIKARGVYASGGYGRFMVSVAPLIGILAVGGLERLLAHIRTSENNSRAVWLILTTVWAVGWSACEMERRAGGSIALHSTWIWVFRCVSAVLILSMLAAAVTRRSGPCRTLGRGILWLLALTWLVQWAVIVRPLRLDGKQALVKEAVVWMHETGHAEAPFFSANPWFASFLGLVEDPRARKDAVLLASMPVGTVFVWDSIYSRNQFHGLEPPAFYRADEHYVLLKTFVEQARGGLKLFVFQKVRETPLPPHPKASYPRSLTSESEPVRGIYYRRDPGPRFFEEARNRGEDYRSNSDVERG